MESKHSFIQPKCNYSAFFSDASEFWIDYEDKPKITITLNWQSLGFWNMTNNQPVGIGYEKNVHWLILSEVIFFDVNIKYIQKIIKDFNSTKL